MTWVEEQYPDPGYAELRNWSPADDPEGQLAPEKYGHILSAIPKIIKALIPEEPTLGPHWGLSDIRNWIERGQEGPIFSPAVQQQMEEELVNQGMSNGAPVIGAPLFKNKALYGPLKRSLTKTIGPEEATGWINLAKDVPAKYEPEPAVGMLKELYDRLGFTNAPEKATRFGIESEFASTMPGRYWKERLKPGHTTSYDDSIKTYPGYKHKVEIGTNPFIQGFDDISNLRKSMAPLNELDPVTGMPIAISGPHVGGTHINMSSEDMTVDEIRKMAEIWMRNEGKMYPSMPAGDMPYRLGYADPMPLFIKRMLQLGKQRQYETMFHTPGPWNLEAVGDAAFDATPTKYWSMNLRNLAAEPGAERMEFRFPHGTLNPNEIVENIIPLEILWQEAKQNAGKGIWFPRSLRDFASRYEDYLHYNKKGILDARPSGSAWNEAADPWPEILQPHYLTKTKGPRMQLSPEEQVAADLGMIQDSAGNWIYPEAQSGRMPAPRAGSDEDALDAFAREAMEAERGGRRSLYSGM